MMNEILNGERIQLELIRDGQDFTEFETEIEMMEEVSISALEWGIDAKRKKLISNLYVTAL